MSSFLTAAGLHSYSYTHFTPGRFYMSTGALTTHDLLIFPSYDFSNKNF